MRPGATPLDGATRFVAFSTTCDECSVRLYRFDGVAVATHRMSPSEGGYFEAEIVGVGHGTLYRFVLDGRELPDPYARFLPFGVDGPAMVVEARHRWQHAMAPRPLREHVIYELHIGTFTDAGTYAAAQQKLRYLADLGITALEILPVAAFAGGRGWGYDGVALYAPFAPYGTPDHLRALVDAAHGVGLAVFLDVVYNHFGPAGNYLSAYSPDYFSSTVRNAWGDAPNYAHPAMRRLVLDNALYWLEDFHFDGLRLDAVHAMVDPSPRHVLRELADEVRARAPGKLLIAEDDRNDPKLITDLKLDGVWADDFHHEVRVTLTGERDGYYAAYRPGAAAVAEAIRGGWLYSGQAYPPSGTPRGKDASLLPAEAFVYCIQNHDQVGNRALGDRLSATVPLDAYCAASTLLLFLPMTPLLFMGQEWAASTPFQFFTDHDPDLGRLVSEGRRGEFRSFAAFSDPSARAAIPDPQDEATFARSRLRWDERDKGEHGRVLRLYQALLDMRRRDPVLRTAGREALEATAHGDLLVVRRWTDAGERVLLVNLSSEGTPLGEVEPLTDGRSVILTTAERPLPPGMLPGYTATILGAGVFR